MKHLFQDHNLFDFGAHEVLSASAANILNQIEKKEQINLIFLRRRRLNYQSIKAAGYKITELPITYFVIFFMASCLFGRKTFVFTSPEYMPKIFFLFLLFIWALGGRFENAILVRDVRNWTRGWFIKKLVYRIYEKNNLLFELPDIRDEFLKRIGHERLIDNLSPHRKIFPVTSLADLPSNIKCLDEGPTNIFLTGRSTDDRRSLFEITNFCNAIIHLIPDVMIWTNSQEICLGSNQSNLKYIQYDEYFSILSRADVLVAFLKNKEGLYGKVKGSGCLLDAMYSGKKVFVPRFFGEKRMVSEVSYPFNDVDDLITMIIDRRVKSRIIIDRSNAKSFCAKLIARECML